MASILASMGDTPTECACCHRKLTDAFVCPPCAQDVVDTIRVIANLGVEAGRRRARQRTNWASGYTPRPAETPLPYDQRASAIIQRIVQLNRACRDMGRPPKGETGLSWIVRHPSIVSTHADGPALARQVQRLHADIEALLDPRPDRRYLGPCDLMRQDCQADLYVAEDSDGNPLSAAVECPACHRQVMVEQRRGELLDGAMDYIGTMKEVTRLLRYYGGTEAVSHDTLRGLVRHGRVTSIGEVMVASEDGRTRFVAAYRVGDILDALRATRRVKRAKKS